MLFHRWYDDRGTSTMTTITKLETGDQVSVKFIKLNPGKSRIGATEETELTGTHFTGYKLGYTFGEDQVPLEEIINPQDKKLDILNRGAGESVSVPRRQLWEALVQYQDNNRL